MSRRKELKRLERGQKFPEQFWNYLVNPITGFSHSRREETVKLNNKGY